MEDTYDIYDRIAKRCLSLSAHSTVNLINGLFNTDYPADSEVTYNWTEGVGDDLRRTLADTIVTINNRHSYHIEFQMTEEGDIIMRVLEYGFRHAVNRQTGPDELEFPEPLIVYLYDRKSFPDEYTLRIRFGKQGVFDYKVPVVKFLNYSLEEIEQKKLIVLLPFELLRLRRTIEKKRTKENMEALKKLVTHDILNLLQWNEEAGNLTHMEVGKLSRMVLSLYHHIYDKYEELQEVGSMAEAALYFDIDILENEIQKLTEKNQGLEEANQGLQETNQGLQEANQGLQETNQGLQEANQDLQEANQSLQETLAATIRLLAATHSAQEIAEQTRLPLEKVKKVLEASGKGV